MCGRFFLDSNARDIAEHYNAPPPEIFSARYNIAPTTPVMAYCDKRLTFFRWGLIPSWAKDISLGNRMFNARAETVADKPAFRQAYRRRRCLIPANGFYEWRTENERKQPYCCHLDLSLFSMAGIWEHWQDAAGNEIQSCAIITTEANHSMSDIHHRMPVHITPDNYNAWLDCSSEKTDIPDALIRDTSPRYQYYAVNTTVNNARNEGRDLIKELE
ncbi:MAG: SOS response-associated peptidase [Gammaproteobacteria bacterium]